MDFIFNQWNDQNVMDVKENKNTYFLSSGENLLGIAENIIKVYEASYGKVA